MPSLLLIIDIAGSRDVGGIHRACLCMILLVAIVTCYRIMPCVYSCLLVVCLPSIHDVYNCTPLATYHVVHVIRYYCYYAFCNSCTCQFISRNDFVYRYFLYALVYIYLYVALYVYIQYLR